MKKVLFGGLLVLGACFAFDYFLVGNPIGLDSHLNQLKNGNVAEAEGIKAVADAKLYEIEKAKEDILNYVKLKTIENIKLQLEKWGGKFPMYYMNSGDKTPQMLLQIPEGK